MRTGLLILFYLNSGRMIKICLLSYHSTKQLLNPENLPYVTERQPLFRSGSQIRTVILSIVLKIMMALTKHFEQLKSKHKAKKDDFWTQI